MIKLDSKKIEGQTPGRIYNCVGQDLSVPKMVYKHADVRPWDPRNDLLQEHVQSITVDYMNFIYIFS